MNTIKKTLIALFTIIAITWSFNLRDPHLLSLRNHETLILLFLFISIATTVLSIESKSYRYGIWTISGILMLKVMAVEFNFHYSKDNILNISD